MAKTTFTLRIENKSDYDDGAVFVHLGGKNPEDTAWFYLAHPGDASLTEFDDTPETLLERNTDGSFVGNAKYFFQLTDMTPVEGSPHLYSMEVPRENLVSGRIYVSFGQHLPGLAISAPGYAFAVDVNGQPMGAGKPVTLAAPAKGTSDATGLTLTGLDIDATKAIYAGEPVHGNSIPADTVVARVTGSHEVVLSKKVPENEPLDVTFVPTVFSKTALQGPSFTGAPDFLIPFEFMELSATETKADTGDSWYALYANTSVVDFFSIGLGMTVDFADGSSRTVGFQGTRGDILKDFDALTDGQACFQGYVVTSGAPLSFGSSVDASKILRVLGPQQIALVNPSGPMKTYLDTAIAAAWAHYGNQPLEITDDLPGRPPYGFKYSRQQVETGRICLQCKAVPEGNDGLDESYALPPPSTGDVFKCDSDQKGPDSFSNSGTSAHKRLVSLLSAAANRGVLADYASWSNDKDGAATFYQDPDKHYNVYSAILHAHAIDGKVYGFGFDDVYGQDPTLSGPIGETAQGKQPPGVGIREVTLTIPAIAKFQ